MGENEFIIPIGQIFSYTLCSTVCFFLRRYKMGLMISFAYVFNWGILHGGANYVDVMGKPIMALFLYLASGLMMAILVFIGFFRED
jgi:uncharacterized membrane protein (UPF0182 family)